MPRHYIYSAILVVAESNVAAAEALAGAAIGRPCEGEIGAPLSADGLDPITHRWCCAALTAEEYLALLAAFYGEGSPGAALGVEVFTVPTPGVDDVPGATTAVPDGEGGWLSLPVVVLDVGDPVPDPAQVHPLCRRWTVDRVLAEIGLTPYSGL